MNGKWKYEIQVNPEQLEIENQFSTAVKKKLERNSQIEIEFKFYFYPEGYQCSLAEIFIFK